MTTSPTSSPAGSARSPVSRGPTHTSRSARTPSTTWRRPSPSGWTRSSHSSRGRVRTAVRTRPHAQGASDLGGGAPVRDATAVLGAVLPLGALAHELLDRPQEALDVLVR